MYGRLLLGDKAKAASEGTTKNVAERTGVCPASCERTFGGIGKAKADVRRYYFFRNNKIAEFCDFITMVHHIAIANSEKLF